MLFDKLCGLAERHEIIKELRPILENAKIFELPGSAIELLPKAIERYEFFQDFFFLPFPVVAIEDNESCIVIMDLAQDQKGFEEDRLFIEILPQIPTGRNYTNAPSEEFVAKTVELSYNAGFNPYDAYVVTTGLVKLILPTAEQLLIDGFCTFSIVLTKDKVVINEERMKQYLMDRVYAASRIQNAAVALQEIMYFNTPDRFVVEEAPSKPLNKKDKKIPRTVSRPKFTLLHPNEIRKKLRLPDEQVEKRKSPNPHWRRRHVRVLKSDRWVNKKGKEIFIAAKWIGPTEATVGKKRYKVRLDL